MGKILNPKMASNVFGKKGEAHDFMEKGGVKYLSNGSAKQVDSNRVFVGELTHGNTEKVDLQKAYAMVNAADKEVLSGVMSLMKENLSR